MNIYIAKNNARNGPYTNEQVVEMVQNGDVLMSDLAWSEGMTEWHALHSMPAIVEAVLPPLPDNAIDQNVRISPPPIPNQNSVFSQPTESRPRPLQVGQTADASDRTDSDKLRVVAIALCFFFGMLGFHSLYAGRKKEGIALLISFVGAFVLINVGSNLGAIIILIEAIIILGHLFGIALGKYKDGRGRLILKWA
jgi:TM2 domain-containing membrane protein YozV